MVTKIKTFIFMDFETTGLGIFSKITELCFIAIQADHLLASKHDLPRIMNKLSLCINPHKLISLQASNITGLSNDALKQMSTFTTETVDMIHLFIKHLPQPACFVAHNGNNFDYPILHKHLERVNKHGNVFEGLLTLDSLQLFRKHHENELEKIKAEETEKLMKLPEELRDDEWDSLAIQEVERLEALGALQEDAEFIARSLQAQKENETTPKKRSLASGENHDDFFNEIFFHPSKVVEKKEEKPVKTCRRKLNLSDKKPSFKLGELFKRMTRLEPMQSHAAEYDVFMLVKCAAAMGEDFLLMANEMAVPFGEIIK